MVSYTGVVAKLENGKYLSRSGHAVELHEAGLFNADRLAAAIRAMRTPGPFNGDLVLLEAQKEDRDAPQIKTTDNISALKFPPAPGAGHKLTFDNGAFVASLVAASEPRPHYDPATKPSFF